MPRRPFHVLMHLRDPGGAPETGCLDDEFEHLNVEPLDALLKRIPQDAAPDNPGNPDNHAS